MKKILFFMLALLAFVACDDLYGGTDDPTAPDATGDVTIEFSEVNDYGFTVTLTPTMAASYYSYLVDDEGIDLSAELSASTLFQGGYSSVASGVVNYSENPSYTFTVEAEEPNLTYYVYAVAGSAEQQSLGEICVNSVTTTYVPICEVSISAEYDKETYVLTATVSFSGDADYVKVGYAEGTSEDEIEAGVDGIIDGSIKSEQLDESGEIQFTISDDASYSAIAVAYYNGEPIDFDYDTFKVDHSAWVSLGMCEYTDDYIASLFYSSSAYCMTYEVEIEENEVTPGLYRLVNPYDEKFPLNDPGDWDEENDYYLEIHAEDPDGVYIEMQELGLDWGYGPIYAYSDACYYMDYGYSLSIVKMLGICGTLDKGVITFPQKELLAYMPGYNASTYYYANYYGMFKVVLPGTLDCSVDVSYEGKLTDTRDRNFAVATVTLGEDVEYALVAMAEGSDHDALVEAIKAGTVDCQTLTESGGVEFACEESGTYTIAVVTYAEDEAQESAYVTFTYTVGSTAEWNLYGTGDYEYYLFLEGSDPGLELYQSSANPSLFKIEHWCYDVDFYFTWDQNTNEILVDEDQYTGMEYSSYGSVYVCDFIDDSGYDYYGCTPSYYKDGIFYFSMEYYCSAGTFCYGYETFTLDGSSFGLTADDLGSYDAFEVSGFGGAYYSSYALAASDNSRKGNVMFTVFDDFDCDVSPIYGDLDEETGVLSFEYYQQFTTYGGYNFWFYTYYDDYAYFLLLNNGDIWGPLWGDMVGSAYGSRSPAYYWDMYSFIYGSKEESGPASIKPASASELHSSKEHALDESRPTSVKPNSERVNYSKQKFNKPAIVELEDGLVLASSSTRPTGDNSSANASKKSGSKKISGKVSTDTKSIKESIRESKGWKN